MTIVDYLRQIIIEKKSSFLWLNEQLALEKIISMALIKCRLRSFTFYQNVFPRLQFRLGYR